MGRERSFEPRFRSRLVCGGSYGRLEGCVCGFLKDEEATAVFVSRGLLRRQNREVNFEAGLLAEHSEFAHEVFTPS